MYILKCVLVSFAIGFWGVNLQAIAQNVELKAVDSLQLEADNFIGIDKFQNLYYIKNNTVFKKTDDQDVIAFQDFQLGDIERVDILNPNKIMVFYKWSNVIVILDNRMTEIDRQNFNTTSPFINVGFAGVSKDQSFWIFNIDFSQLELYNYRQNKTIAKSLPISQEVLGMKNNFNLCYLITDTGVLVYNIYGSLVHQFSIKDIQSIGLFKNQLLIYTNDSIKVFDEDFNLSYALKTDRLVAENLFYAEENLYIYDGNKIIIYNILSK